MILQPLARCAKSVAGSIASVWLMSTAPAGRYTSAQQLMQPVQQTIAHLVQNRSPERWPGVAIVESRRRYVSTELCRRRFWEPPSGAYDMPAGWEDAAAAATGVGGGGTSRAW